MKIPVSIIRKQKLLQWLLEKYLQDDYELSWFFEEILEDENSLMKIHFVENIRNYPKGIIVSTYESNEQRFLFIKNQIETTDVYTAFHELNLYREEDFYIQLNCPDLMKFDFYRSMLLYQRHNVLEERKMIHNMLDELSYNGTINFLKQKIDEALIANNQAAFIDYSNELKKVLNNNYHSIDAEGNSTL